SYQRCLDLLLELVARDGQRCQLIVASHNEASVSHAVRRSEGAGRGAAHAVTLPACTAPSCPELKGGVVLRGVAAWVQTGAGQRPPKLLLVPCGCLIGVPLQEEELGIARTEGPVASGSCWACGPRSPGLVYTTHHGRVVP
ncbi:hydroxyproline dehydrogenase-like, partial [Chelydra serpentina]